MLFRSDPCLAFTVADRAISHYEGGTIVCDHPTVNYRLCFRWGVEASDLLGNHYSPHYYGVKEPLEYAKWLAKHNVTLWLYASSRAYPVWAVASRKMPGLLVLKEEVYGMRIYEVDHAVLEKILSG